MRVIESLQASRPLTRGISWSTGALLAASLLGATIAPGTPGNASVALPAGSAKSLPNILILLSDGINAKNMSIYGYERDTTPFLRTYLEKHPHTLVENAFGHTPKSSGSVTSILTGKLPITTGVFYRPEVLKGIHAYQHLPGILRSLGIGAP
ncbi:MAG: sulfatase-like hydrolase/transferase [Gammaproteobacteria bacterium]|nr:sulfatase-like hydrolase/transferase [Gammaproteobacteria bacterium]